MPPRFVGVMLWWSATVMVGTCVAGLLAGVLRLTAAEAEGSLVALVLTTAVTYAYGAFLATPIYILVLLGFAGQLLRHPQWSETSSRVLVACLVLALPVLLAVYLIMGALDPALLAFVATWCGFWVSRLILPWLRPGRFEAAIAPAPSPRRRP